MERKFTRKNKRNLLAAAIACAVALGFNSTYAYAEEAAADAAETSEPAAKSDSPAYKLEKVVVEGKKDKKEDSDTGFVGQNGSVGFLGEKNVMDTPFTQTTLTSKTIETFGAASQPLDSILSNSPSIQASGSALHNDFTFRGFRANGTSSYVNGIPGMFTQFNAPTFMIDHIDLISGPNSGISGTGAQYESDTAGGLVNFVSKKAPEQPLTRYTQTFSGYGSFGEYMDIARRFGRNNAWGVRINTEMVNGETSIHGENIKARGIFANIDHRDENSTTNILTGYRELEIQGGQRWFKFGSSVTSLPSTPDASDDYGFDGMVKASRGWIFALNHEQKVSKDWKVFFNGGLNRNTLTKNVSATNSAFTVKNNAGDYDLYVTNGGTPMNTYYAQLGTQGKIAGGAVTHNVTLAVDKSWRNRESAKVTVNDLIGTGNLYSGITQTLLPNTDYSTGLTEKQRFWGWSLADNIEYQKWEVLLGAHKHFATVDSYTAKTGTKTASVDSNAFCPTYGIVYKPATNISLYASHSENFNKGTVVGSSYVNAGDILAPAKAKQDEIGIKYEHAGVLTTLSLFDIEQANNIEVADTSSSKYYLIQDGRERHKGVELAASGSLGDKWTLMGGITRLIATQEKTKGGQYDGYDVSGRAKWNAVAAVEYQADSRFSMVGRVRYTGESTINYQKLAVPGYTTFDLGLKYKTKIDSVPAVFSLMCYNLTDKDYWQVARGDQLYVSTPRTVVLSAQVDL
ncbi:TonB-dependent siderophore receptor [Sporomusa sp. KB1]|jgi:iron complex outermembrane receptor protein|uniref:TonB-dependent receptor n=1 Tax=Sporomusa sp. KB1 TaxID=943346 RepID=UPI0011A967E5|nr:TonB-dependent siderophore receptor [Sporomusa sp. KB1]TWH45553.1 iron complex outermembrane receptor protein [Sporomusa sp. KB1]